VKTALGDAFANVVDSAKSKLWHGETKDALTKLTKLGDNVTDEATRSKITGCMTISTVIKLILLTMTNVSGRIRPIVK